MFEEAQELSVAYDVRVNHSLRRNKPFTNIPLHELHVEEGSTYVKTKNIPTRRLVPTSGRLRASVTMREKLSLANFGDGKTRNQDL